MFPPNMLGQQRHWTLTLNLGTKRLNSWCQLLSVDAGEMMRNGPQMLSLCGTQNTRACERSRTSWRNIPSHFLPLTAQLKAHICLESATVVLGGRNIASSRLLGTMKNVMSHLMESTGRDVGRKRMQVLDVGCFHQPAAAAGIKMIFWKAFLKCAQAEALERRALSPQRGVPTARCSAPSSPAPSRPPGFH